MSGSIAQGHRVQELLLHKGTECKSYRGTDGSYYKAVELEWHCAHKSEIPENEE